LAPNYSDNFKEDISTSPEIIFGIPLENKYAGGNYMIKDITLLSIMIR
jgi:hypothetical protein